MEADPRRPYKMYAAMLSAFLVSLVGSQVLPLWGNAVATAIVAALAVYYVPNPLRRKNTPAGGVESPDEGVLF